MPRLQELCLSELTNPSKVGRTETSVGQRHCPTVGVTASSTVPEQLGVPTGCGLVVILLFITLMVR